MKTTLIALLFFSSCQMYGDVKDAASKLNDIANKIQIDTAKVNTVIDQTLTLANQLGEKGAVVAGALQGVKDVLAKADTNKDGKVSGFSEMWIAIAGAISALGVGGAAFMRAGAAKESAAKAQKDADDLYQPPAVVVSAQPLPKVA